MQTLDGVQDDKPIPEHRHAGYDDEENDCGSSHICYPGLSGYGYCILDRSHSNGHFCGTCNSDFY